MNLTLAATAFVLTFRAFGKTRPSVIFQRGALHTECARVMFTPAVPLNHLSNNTLFPLNPLQRFRIFNYFPRKYQKIPI